jgi:ABC-type multidrug transport system permease subunit
VGLAASLPMVGALVRRGFNEVARVPAGALPGVLAPTILVLGVASVFGKLTSLPGFTGSGYITFIVAVGILQGSGFTGAATGVNFARDIEQGWFDRLLVSPAPRKVLLLGTIVSASVRSLLPVAVLVGVSLVVGASWPGLGGLLLAVGLAMLYAAVAAAWSVTLALRFRTQSAAPLMQAGNFVAVLFTASYAPHVLLSGWLAAVATWNPVNYVVEAARQGFVGDVTWSGTWPGLAALAGLGALLVALALRALGRFES